MPPELGTYVSWADANNGNPSTLSQFRTCLSRYSCSKVVCLCGVLNSFLRIWEGSKAFLDAHAELVRSAFPSPWSEKLIAASKDRSNKRVVFHRQQLLFVAKEAILHCKEQAEDPFRLPYWGKIGAAFLMANDHLHFRPASTASEEEEMIGMLPNLVLVQEYSGANRLAYRVVRSHLMYTRIATALSQHPNSVDLAQAFQKLTGLTLVEHEALCFGTVSKYLKVKLAAFKANPATFLLSASNFQSTAVPADKVKLFLAEVSATAEQFRSHFAKKDSGLVDFTWFRDRPLLRQGDTLYALDPGFLGDKIETGPFWRVLNSLPDDRSKERLHAFWGALFEEYLNWLFSGSVDGSANVYYHSPKYVSDGTQVCDGIIRCGSSAVLMEYKGSTFTAEGKYGGKGDLLVKEIKKKLVSAEKGRKGATQLASAIHRLFRRGGHEAVQGVDLTSVKTILPVLVTRDEIGAAVMVNRLLDNEFQQAMDKRSVRPHKVTPLFCLTADEAEYVSAYLRTVRFSDVLQERYDADSSLQTPLQFWELPSLAGNLRNELLKREFEDFSNGVARTLFPGAPPLRHPWRDDDPEGAGS
jgi:hypothetical protein